MNFTQVINNIDAVEIIDFMSQEKLAAITDQDKKHMAIGAGTGGIIGAFRGADAAKSHLEYENIVKPFSQGLDEAAMPKFTHEVEKMLKHPKTIAELKTQGKYFVPLNAVICALLLAGAGAGIGLGVSKLNKESSELVDELYKMAKMTVPTKEEAKKENDLPEIECENCDYVGPTEATGECPVCKAIMGIKPKQQNIPSSPFTLELLEPRSGISMQDAEMIGRMEESSFSAW